MERNETLPQSNTTELSLALLQHMAAQDSIMKAQEREWGSVGESSDEGHHVSIFCAFLGPRRI